MVMLKMICKKKLKRILQKINYIKTEINNKKQNDRL